MKRLFIYLALTTTALFQNVKAVVIDGLSYSLGTDEAMIDNNNGHWEGELIIPSEVTYEGKTYTVTSIAWLAFDHCTTITKVTIPKTVTKIWHYSGFDVSKNPFRGCENLESIEVEEDNPAMCSVDGVLFNKDRTKLYAYPGGAKREKYVVPETVAGIEMDAFSGNKYIKSIEVTNNSATLSGGVFASCSNLEEVILPENLTYISAFMFQNCTSLKSITIPSGVKGMGEQVFFGCSSLTSVTLPEGIQELGSLTFMNCSSLQSVTLPKTLPEIVHGMFSGCSSLKNVIIPKGIKQIYSAAFKNCTSLKVLDLPTSITRLDQSFMGCEFDALVIRGQISTIFQHTFKNMSEKSVIYAADMTKIEQVYNGKVLPLSSYNPTAIRNLFESPDNGIAPSSKVNVQSSKLFDLSGRRLSAPPAQGLYIEDGKVKASHR